MQSGGGDPARPLSGAAAPVAEAGARGAADAPGAPGGPGVPAPWTRRTTALLAGLCLAALASLVWLRCPHDDPTLATGDGAVYVVTARNLAEGRGYTYLGEPFTIRPPGFPALLVPVVARGGESFLARQAPVLASAVLCVALLFAYQRRRLGEPLALAVAAAVWLNPGFQRLASQVMSDVPGTALMLACLLLARRAERRPSLARDVLLGVAIGLAATVRTIDVLVLPAVLCARTARAALGPRELRPRGPRAWLAFALRRLAPVALAVWLTLLPWSLRNAAVEPAVPPDHTLFHSYSVAMWHTDWGDPDSPRIGLDELGERVRTRVGDLAHVLGSRMQVRNGTAAHRLFAALGVLAWLVVLVVRRGTGDFLTGGMLLLIAVYFGFMNRLVLPVYVMVLPAAAQVVQWGAARAAGRRAGTAVACALVLALAWVDFEPRWGWEAMEHREAALRAACEAVEPRFPPDAPLAADFGGHFSVALDRPVYTLRWALRRGGVEGALELLERYGVQGVILDLSQRSNQALAEELARRGSPVRRAGPQFAVARVPRPGPGAGAAQGIGSERR